MDEDFALTEAPHSGRSNAWMITFADLLSLMLTFFVLLYSMSEIKKTQWEEVSQSMQMALNPTRINEIIFEEEPQIPVQEIPNAANLDYVYAVIQDKLGEMLSREITLLRHEDRLVLSLSNNMLFASGSYEIAPKGREILNATATAISTIGNKIVIIGHTDPVPVRKSSKYSSNWELSLARANRVAELVYSAGYTKPIEVFGKASSHYDEISAKDEQHERLSRRVDIEIFDILP